MTVDPAQHVGDRMTVTHDDHGTLLRVDLDQVGWIGHSGRLYVIGDDPSVSERGGFAPLWRISHTDLVDDDRGRVAAARPTAPDQVTGHRHLVTFHRHPNWHGHCDPHKRGFKRCRRWHWHIWWRHDHELGDEHPSRNRQDEESPKL